MKIVQARKEQIPTVVGLLAACMRTMRNNGIDQWDDIYPNEEIVMKDVNDLSLYVLEENDLCIGAVSLNQEQDVAYQQVNWLGGEPVLVVHRLCIDPNYQGAGLGSRLMDFAEEHAKRNAYASIRLDAYTGNPTAFRMYERRGYRKAGQVFFPRRRLPFFCFEKILAAQAVPQRMGPTS
jgi:ribosomal protein S18 acetylase RimI-like enzyme